MCFEIVCEVHVCTLVGNIYDKGNIAGSCFLSFCTARVDKICYEFINYLDLHASLYVVAYGTLVYGKDHYYYLVFEYHFTKIGFAYSLVNCVSSLISPQYYVN